MTALGIRKHKSNFWDIVRTVYLYAVSLIALVIFTINMGRMVNLGLETWVFPLDRGIENVWEIQQCEESGLATNPVNQRDTRLTQEEIDSCIAKTEEMTARREHNERNRTLSSSLAFVLVSLPIWILHYRRALKMKG